MLGRLHVCIYVWIKRVCLPILQHFSSSAELRKNEYFLVPVPASACLFSTLGLNIKYGANCERDSSRFPRRRPFILFIPPVAIGPIPSFYRVMQLLRTDGVHYRKSAGTGLVVVSNVCGLFRHHHGSINVRLSFPTPTILIMFKEKSLFY